MKKITKKAVENAIKILESGTTKCAYCKKFKKQISRCLDGRYIVPVCKNCIKKLKIKIYD